MTISSSADSGKEDVRSTAGIEPITVVGIGASAGGIPALTNFLSNASASMQMAFVVILHLSPEHESHADAILQRSTSMPVQQVSQVTRIEKDHVYVIAPGKQLYVSDGYLNVTERDAQDHKFSMIDEFFRPSPRRRERARWESCSPAPARTARRGSAGSRQTVA